MNEEVNQETVDEQSLALFEEDASGEMEIKVLAKFLGYRELPVTIDEFLDNPYYMGNVSKNLYPFWRDVLRQIFPDEIHTRYPIIVFTGAIGTGKSTAVRFMAEYMKHRVLCTENPYDTFQFVPGKHLKFSFFHKTSTLAQTDFLDVIDTWERMSPYFKEMDESGRLYELFEQVGDSVKSNTGIGSDVLFYNLSELNFISKERAHEKLDAALKRWSSRFERFINYFGMVIIDTSSQNDDSIADEFIAKNPYGNKVLPIHTNKWKVRSHLNYYGRKGWFQVYIGDGVHSPFIIDPTKGRVLTSEMDPERVELVPEECRADFEFDLETALMDEAGISVTSTDKFFKNTEKMLMCFDQPQYSPDVVKFDFYDKTDKLIYRFDRSLRDIPPDRIIYIRYDIGVVRDYAGIAIEYFNKWKVYDADQKIRQPDIICPLAVAISRFEGTETPIYHLFEFVMDLNKRFEVGRFSTDQFASRQLLQDLEREKIPNRYLSVDRTSEAYVYTKTLLNNNLLHLPYNMRLRKEFTELKWIGQKVDHPEGGSKDISDSVAGCTYDLYQDIDKAGQLSLKYKVETHSQYMQERVISTNDILQSMLQEQY